MSGHSGIGHNRGPAMDAGVSWRRHCWSKARAALLPTLPLEVVRLRVKRAEALGLAYRDYATVRATTGRDVVALLFSSDALRIRRSPTEMPSAHADKLAAIEACARLLAAHAPLDPAALAQALPVFDAVTRAPSTWARAPFADFPALDRLPRDAVLLVGDGPHERPWVAAARLAGYVPAERYFA